MPACLAFLPAIAAAQDRCEVDAAQRLFGQAPRPTDEIERLLASCEGAGSTDYRGPMFLGVMARDAGDRDRAIMQLRKAHEMAPEALNPALELGFTLEVPRPAEARMIYEQVLARDPASRPAMLGLARVARSRNRLDEARGIYERLLAVDPRDADALNGMAWLKLADRKRDAARVGFERVLAIDPDNAEAKIGLANAPNVYRYRMEASGLAVSSEQGTSWGFQARASAAVTAFDALEVGWRHFSTPLLLVSKTGLLAVSTEDITLAYHRLVPSSYAISLVYDHREHPGGPTEHWIDGSITLPVIDGLEWFGAYRRAFGDPRYEGQLFRTGLNVSVARRWHVTATIYHSQQEAFRNNRGLVSGGVDVLYAGPRNLLIVAGVGASPSIDNFDLHARALLPVTDRVALQFIASHDSFNAATSLSAGLILTW